MLEKWILYRQMNNVELAIILAILCILILPGTSIALPNEDCFVCHTSPQNRSINQSLYNSNNHSILECIDCHENSTSRSDQNHGQFIRKLDGSNLTSSGPKTTNYSSDNFSLCYFCHAEEKVVGVTSDMNNKMHPNHVNKTPIIVNSIGTNYININASGYSAGGNVPANIHWDHLDSFGSYNFDGGAKFDSNHDGVDDSYQSCPSCHNVHGTDYPKMTRNSLAISYSIGGDYGFIGSEKYYNRTNPDYICSPACHSSGGIVYKYYRPEKKLFEDCLSCHTTDMTRDFNISAFGQGVHVDINTTNGANNVNNSDCWMCHYKKDMKKSNIRTCENCHVEPVPNAPSAPLITSHKPGETNKSSCQACHELVKLDPGLNSAGQNYPNVTAHYAQLPAVITANYCDYCHGPQASSLFKAPYRNITSFYHNSSNASFPEDSNCRTCHTRTDVPADPLANNNSNFHNMTTEYGDVKNTSVANCIDCHIDHNTQFASAPSPTHGTSGMVLKNCYQCHGTKVSGSNATKLHDVRSFVTSGCVECHVDRNDVNTSKFGLHINLNTTDRGLNNLTDSDCNTCHFGGWTGDLPMIPGGATSANTYYCQNCHTSAGIVSPGTPKSSIKVDDFGHGSNQCISCHAPDMYHVKGTAGPGGRVENPGWDLISPSDYAGCHDCHTNHNGIDTPFHAPGIDPNTTTGGESQHRLGNNQNHGSDCYSSCHGTSTNPHKVSIYDNTFEPTLSNVAISPSSVLVNKSVDISAVGSALVNGPSLQIEAAQYRIINSTGQILIDWIRMNATDGRFNSSIETVNATFNTTGLSEGMYNVSVGVMASGPRTNRSIPYYPLNGDWSYQEATLIIEQPKGFINGTVRNGSEVISNVTVAAGTESAITDGFGNYSLRLVNGTYTLTATKNPEFYSYSTSGISVTAPYTTTWNFDMNKKPTGTITGRVTNNS